MKMLMIVFRDSLEDEVLFFLKDRDIKAYTVVPKVIGSGETGTVTGSPFFPGFNEMVLVVLPDDHADQIVAALKTFRDNQIKTHPAGKTSIRVFVLPCTQAV
jgi:nitrogen regulatory protein PII